MGHRNPEAGHDGVADELVEHPSLVLDAVDHQREILVEHRHRALRAEPFGVRREAADVREQHRRFHRLPPEHVRSRGDELVGDARIHVARHRRLEPLFTRDIFDHEHRPNPLVLDRSERKHGDVARDRLRAEHELGIHQHFRLAARPDRLDFFEHPGVAAGEEISHWLVEHLRRRRPENPQACRIAGDDFPLVIDGHHAIRHRFKHRLTVVLHVLHVGEQLGILERYRDLGGERPQTRLILGRERTAALVEHLRDADHSPELIGDRHAEDRAREIAGALVEGGIEPQIGIGIRDVDRLARGEDSPGDAEVSRQADLHRLQPLANLRPQFLRLLVVKKQRGTVGVEQPSCLPHHPAEQRPELDVGGNLRDDLDKLHLLSPHRLHPLNELGPLQGDGALGGHRLEDLEVFLVKSTVDLVDRLDDADNLPLQRLDRHAEDAAGHEAGLLVVGPTEARIGIRIVDDHRLATGERMARDAGGIEQPDLAPDVALRNA